jgi:hypothetical protein
MALCTDLYFDLPVGRTDTYVTGSAQLNGCSNVLHYKLDQRTKRWIRPGVSCDDRSGCIAEMIDGKLDAPAWKPR